MVRARSARDRRSSAAPYFLEEVRRELEGRYGAKQLYENGLSIQTAIDLRLQEAATQALNDGLRRIDKRRGFRKPRRNVIAEGHTIESFRQPRWDRPMTAGQIVPAVVTAVDGAGDSPARRRAARDHRPQGLCVDRQDVAGAARDARRSRRNAAADDRPMAPRRRPARSSRRPEVEGAVLILDNRTGQILTMVGGYSFERSKFNRATQAYRQVGSAFKPFVYTAAIDSGYTPVTLLMDTPVSFSGGAGQPAYTPLNYDRQFEGPITLRRALEQSRNIPAVRVMDQLGPSQVIAYARRLGLESPLPPYLAVALGAAEATLIEMTSAYSVFPNQGVRMRPYSVLKVSDREGNVLEENRPEPKDAIRADTAYRDDEPPARRRAARHRAPRPPRSTGRSAERPARPTTTPTPGSSASTLTSRLACGRDSIRSARWDRPGTGADRPLPIWIGHHEGVDRQAHRAADLRGPWQHRVRLRRSRLRQPCPRRHARRHHRVVHRRHAARVGLPAVARVSPVYSSSGAACPSVPDAFFIRYTLMNPSRSPSSTRFGSPTSSLVRWSLTI